MKKLLIANRGEIACRIMRTARKLNIATVAVYSAADRDARFVAEADEAVAIGPAPASQSYLDIKKIIAAAHRTGADAIHPGYGFLAENPDFAEACSEAGITFVGPTGVAMRQLGNKASAKKLAQAQGIPVVPGYWGEDQGARRLAQEAQQIGVPLLIKAVAGGGGRGMRRVDDLQDLAGEIAGAKREAKAAFNDDRLMLEKLIVAPRHIEVQFFADRDGNVVHLFERDCSLQRRNQKVIEEAPAPGLSDDIRTRLANATLKLVRSIDYQGAGTVEFLIGGGSQSQPLWYFIEANTRLQVEHPVTEEITGVDLVAWQLKVAAGERLPCTQHQISCTGHAVEARICAEDPERNFLPGIGRIDHFSPYEAAGVRWECGIKSGSYVSPCYDSLLAKVIAVGDDRNQAMARLHQALARTILVGPPTNIRFLKNLLLQPDVRSARSTTELIARDLQDLAAGEVSRAAIEEGVRHLLDGGRREPDSGPWAARDAFQLGGARSMTIPVEIAGYRRAITVFWSGNKPKITFDEEISEVGRNPAGQIVTWAITADRVAVIDDQRRIDVTRPGYGGARARSTTDLDSIAAPIDGRVVCVAVNVGDNVARGAILMVVEAMKMEHILRCPRDATISKLDAAEGMVVTKGQRLIRLRKESGGSPSSQAERGNGID